MLNRAGIYIIRNKKNGHCYVGQSHNIESRWKGHRDNLNKNKHHSPYLQNAWNLYGEKAFVFEVLEFCKTRDLNQKEQEWIIRLNPVYNCIVFLDNNAWLQKESEIDMSIKDGLDLKPIIHPENVSDIRCIDCKQPYEMVVGSSSERCYDCNQKYLKNEKMGLIDRWHRWVYGGDKNPGY